MDSLQPLLGLLQVRPNPLLVEMAGECGYDFIILDGQRGVFSESEFRASLKTLVAAKEVLSMARLAGHGTQDLSAYLEMGVDVIVAPQVSTLEQARTLAGAMGSKGSASLIVILESALGAKHAGKIPAVDGVDGVFIGPVNLSTDLGRRGDYAHPSYVAALSNIERAATAVGKVFGTVPNEGFPIEALLPRGHRLFIPGGDRLLMREAMSAQVAWARASLRSKPTDRASPQPS